jgi:hypothetical protein
LFAQIRAVGAIAAIPTLAAIAANFPDSRPIIARATIAAICPIAARTRPIGAVGAVSTITELGLGAESIAGATAGIGAAVDENCGSEQGDQRGKRNKGKQRAGIAVHIHSFYKTNCQQYTILYKRRR